MLFVVYQQIELDTFLPIALEFKRLKKRKEIKFLFVDQKNFKIINQSRTLNNALNRCGKFYVSPRLNNKIHYFIRSVLLKIEIVFWIYKSKCKVVFFPSFGHSQNNKFLNFFLNIFKVKKFLLWKLRHVEKTNVTLNKIGEINVPIKSKNFFDGYIYYHSLQKGFLKILKKENLIEKDNLFNIGLPGTSLAWQKFVNEESQRELKELQRRFQNISNIYTIIGSKSYNLKRHFNDTITSSKQLSLLVKEIFILDPNCIVLFKPHPREQEKTPEAIFKFFDITEFPRFTFTYLNTDVLSKMSKIFLFFETNNVVSTTFNILKINFANINHYYKRLMKITNVRLETGYGDIRLNLKKDWKKKLKKIIFETNSFKTRKYFQKEKDLIKNNKLNINKLNIIFD